MKKSDPASIWLVICVAICISTLRLSMALANEMVLWRAYGQARVAREHLQITQVKPQLVVSNGDTLYGQTFAHYVIGMCFWLAISFVTLLVCYKCLLPQRFRRELMGSAANQTGRRLALPWAASAIVLFMSVALLPSAVA